MKAGLPSLVVACALAVTPYCCEAAPIQLQVTSVSEGNTDCNTYTVSGANFSFASDIFGYCSGQGIYGSPGGTLPSSVVISAPPYPTNTPGQGQTLGGISVPGNPGRVAFFTGFFSSSGPAVAIPSSPTGNLQLQTTVTLQGTLTACLLPAGAISGGPCDPAYTDFAIVNFDLTGLDVFTGGCLDAYTCFFSQNFTATASAVPEPAALGTMSVAGLGLVVSLFLKQRNQKITSRTQAAARVWRI